MKRVCVVFALLAFCLFALNCGQEQTSTSMGRLPGLTAPQGRENAPPRYYTHYWSPAGDSPTGVSLETIDTVHGVGVPYLDNILTSDFSPGGKGMPAPLGITFDLDGTVYTIVDWLYGADPYLAELAKIDLHTGQVTVIASIENHFCGSEIDACGNLYTVGFQPPPPNDGVYFSRLYGDKLCRIDKYTGAVTPIGNGTGLPDVMDLAFDSHGTLWATTQNKLYTIDLQTGVATERAAITNVPPAPPGETNPRMVMSIAFDRDDVLYGTAIVGFWVTNNTVATIMRIDQTTGEGTVLGQSVLGYNHGGDTMPSEVRIAHRLGNGTYRCQTISLDALPGHLAHGDYVPGTNGHSCDCP